MDVVDRRVRVRVRAEQEPTEQLRARTCTRAGVGVRVRGDGDQGRAPADVLAHRFVESGVLDHRAEPVLHLARQAQEAGEVSLLGESDHHPGSLADKGGQRRCSTAGAEPGSGRPADSVMNHTATPPTTAAAIR